MIQPPVRTLLATLALMACAPALAEEPVPGEPDTHPGGTGLQLHLDPETGEATHRPADEAAHSREARLRRVLDRSDAGLEVRELPDGSRIVDLEGRFQSMSVLKADAQGQLQSGCISGARGLEAVIEESREAPDEN